MKSPQDIYTEGYNKGYNDCIHQMQFLKQQEDALNQKKEEDFNKQYSEYLFPAEAKIHDSYTRRSNDAETFSCGAIVLLFMVILKHFIYPDMTIVECISTEQWSKLILLLILPGFAVYFSLFFGGMILPSIVHIFDKTTTKKFIVFVYAAIILLGLFF